MIALGKLAVPLVVSLVAIGSSGRAHADDAGIEFFEKKIRPLLVAHCSECHAADAKKLGAGCCSTVATECKGGDTGAAVVPGKPDESLLIKAVRYTDGSVKMPPKGKLPAAAIADLEEWIKRGAPDPRDKPVASKANDSWEETMRVRGSLVEPATGSERGSPATSSRRLVRSSG